MTTEILLTGKEWQEQIKEFCVIRDPDGWRGVKGKNFALDKISKAEFIERMIPCTLGFNGKDAHERLDAWNKELSQYPIAGPAKRLIVTLPTASPSRLPLSQELVTCDICGKTHRREDIDKWCHYKGDTYCRSHPGVQQWYEGAMTLTGFKMKYLSGEYEEEPTIASPQSNPFQFIMAGEMNIGFSDTDAHPKKFTFNNLEKGLYFLELRSRSGESLEKLVTLPLVDRSPFTPSTILAYLTISDSLFFDCTKMEKLIEYKLFRVKSAEEKK